MRINPPKLSKNEGQIKITSLIEYQNKQKCLWYTIDRKYAEFLTWEKLDAFLLAVLPLAMENNEPIYVEGAISEKLFYNLTNYFGKIFNLLIPSLTQVKIIPKGLDNGKLCQSLETVTMGFSGGIDSFCSFIDHISDDLPKSYQLTHLVYCNVGSHGVGGRNLFEQRYQRLLDFAEEYELPFVKIDSNLQEIVPIDFRLTHIIKNVSAILLLQKLFSKYLYSSAYKYQDCFVGKSHAGSFIEPIAMHLLSSENTEIISTGCQYSRVEKTIRVAEFEPSYRYLDVCVHTVDSPENCSQCWKCARTILTLEISGKDHLYKQVFDLNKFAEVKENYIASIINSEQPLDKELIDFALSQNYHL